MTKVSIEGAVSIDDEWTLPIDGKSAGDIFERLAKKYASDAITYALNEEATATFNVDLDGVVFSIPLLGEGGDAVFLHTDFLSMIADEIKTRDADSDSCT